jgi:sec-independent protein translocase protein TatB
MFEVGFQELALIFGVALLVLGPARLSSLVSKVGRWVGKARSMARDFRQQLESEVNLEELNKLTDQQTRQARGSTTPPIPPEFTGAPLAESTPTYPYSAPPDNPVPAETPVTDDTYSHAHAGGDAPMPYVEEPVASMEAPQQTDLDLSPPPPDEPDYSDLPPDDARRYS